MSDQFAFDVFLSHSAKDKPVVRAIAKRLKKDGLRVWFDEWELKPSDKTRAKIEEGLEQSRVLVLCISANAFGSDWVQLEAGTLRFRDPLNTERRFIPLRLDQTPIKPSIAQFVCIDWSPAERGQYARLLRACGLPADEMPGQFWLAEKAILLYKSTIWACVFSSDGKRALTGGGDSMLRLWDIETGQLLRVFKGHAAQVRSLAWSRDESRAVSGSGDNTVRLWDVETGRCLQVLKGHTRRVSGVALSTNQRYVLSASWDNTLRLWEVGTGKALRVFEGHTDAVNGVEWSADQRRAISGSDDKTVRIWDVEAGRCLHVLEDHTQSVNCVTLSRARSYAFSGSDDNTACLWDLETGRCLRILEGHTSGIRCVALSADQRYALSGSKDGTVRVWEVETGHCLRVLQHNAHLICSIAWSNDGRWAIAVSWGGGISFWNLSKLVVETQASEAPIVRSTAGPDQVQYTNAKVLLVGDSASGKTGLSKVLAGEKWRPSDSTVGAWATQWKLPASSTDGLEREVWLWDFGGQADQRLIHQLYMEDAALAVLVFDGQKEDLFETLRQWDRDLARASREPFTKLLVAGRVDAGGLRVSRNQVEAFAKERGFVAYLETSAKTNLGCQELKNAILMGIRWADIPWRSSPRLFKRLKEEILLLKDEGGVIVRFNELRDALRLKLTEEDALFKDEELKAVVSLLTGPGVLWELAFGSWVLLQPEAINAYAQAVIQTLRADEHERGCLAEERVLSGELTYYSSMKRLEADEERFVLLAMHQTLVERGLCLREHTDKGPLLIFPSYYRRERPELAGHPAVLVSYRFSGFLDDIYATLVVRLHHTKPFQQDQLWRYAADFRTLTGKQLGVKLTRRSEGTGELEVYFDPSIPLEEKIIFSRYIHEHLLQKGHDVARLRHYVCPHCGTPAGNREVAMKKLEAGKKDIPCVSCDDPSRRIPLWDQMEELFASSEIQQRVRALQQQSAIVLDNESKERALVGDVISTVALAGQICREFNVSDHGIDMEIEFKDDDGEATGQKLYLQLKSGDSYLRERKSDSAEIFVVKNQRHLQYWMAQLVPVMLVIRTSEGEVRWMEVRDWLKRATNDGQMPVKQIVFKGDRFDVMSVRRWREKMLDRDLGTKVRGI